MVIGGRARTTVIEIDLSDRVPGFPGVYGCFVLNTRKGSYDPTLVTSDSDFLKRYTVYEKVQVGESLSLFEALYFLQKNNKLWVIRANDNALYGGCVLSQDKPFNDINVTFNQYLFTVNLRHVTEAEITVSELVRKTASTGDMCMFSCGKDGVLPEGLFENKKYYLIPFVEDEHAYRIANSYEDALEGNFIEFTGDFEGQITLTFGNDLVNMEVGDIVKDPTQYQLNTSDGRPAGINSTFTIDLDNDQINVTEEFWETCATGDALVISGTTDDDDNSSIPTVATGLPIKDGDVLYCIKTPQEGVNADKFKIQVARSFIDAKTGVFVNFATTGRGFTLAFETKTTQFKVEEDNLDIVNDMIIGIPDGFFSACEDGDKIRFTPDDKGTLPVVSGEPITEASIYYVVKGTKTEDGGVIQVSRTRDGSEPVNFTTDLASGTSFSLNLVEKRSSTNANIDISNDTLVVTETFYSNVETGYACKVTSDGKLPKGLKEGVTYYVIKPKKRAFDNLIIMLANTPDNAELGVPVDITDPGECDPEMGYYHTITDIHNTVYTGYNEPCMGIFTKTPTSEEIFIKLIHYPYGSEENWSEADKTVARTLVEPYSFQLEVWKKWEDGSFTMQEKFLMSRKKDAVDGSQTNIYCEEVAKRSSYITLIDNPNVSDEIYPANQVSLLKLAHGSHGDIATTGDMILGLNKIANTRKYRCSLIMDGGYSIPAYQKAIIDICEARQWTAGILSTPLSLELSANYLADLLDYRNVSLNSSTSHCALYSPHLKVYDRYNNREIYISPTGHIGGNISEVGINQELWYPVAGNRRGNLNVLDLSRVFEDADEDELYDAGINPIDFDVAKGIRIWGQKTLLRRNSALDRLNVRLLLVVIEPAMKEFLDDFLFEINDVITRNLIKAGLTSYMEGIKTRRGVYDFNVICDESNNTNDDVDNYNLNVHVFIQPSKSTEYINLYIAITRTGASMSMSAIQNG